MVLTRAKLERFTAFEDLDVEFSPGINVFVGGKRDWQDAFDEGVLRRL